MSAKLWMCVEIPTHTRGGGDNHVQRMIIILNPGHRPWHLVHCLVLCFMFLQIPIYHRPPAIFLAFLFTINHTYMHMPVYGPTFYQHGDFLSTLHLLFPRRLQLTRKAKVVRGLPWRMELVKRSLFAIFFTRQREWGLWMGTHMYSVYTEFSRLDGGMKVGKEDTCGCPG